ncbi:eukaryotic translation elongation factor 1 epsilon-1 isoform X2 [Periplaneta americana]|uniref:eukaryotic translation elongation factor 1 epsilon-1 isoform X2 n=1 Tax=Periplaneta americana TaxID=6978 RepID=UPI0037E9877A
MVVCNNECIKQIGNYLQIKCGKLSTDASGRIPVVTGIGDSNEKITGFGTIVISLAKQCSKSQFGKTPEDEALVRQWIEYAVCYGNYVDLMQTARQVLKELNSVLATRAYFVANSQTLADIVLYYVLHSVMIVCVLASAHSLPAESMQFLFLYNESDWYDVVKHPCIRVRVFYI